MSYESAHKRFANARERYHQLESELAVARAEMNAAERECSVEWRKVIDEAHARRSAVASDQCGGGA